MPAGQLFKRGCTALKNAAEALSTVAVVAETIKFVAAQEPISIFLILLSMVVIALMIFGLGYFTHYKLRKRRLRKVSAV